MEESDEILSQTSYNMANITQITLREEPVHLDHFEDDLGSIIRKHGILLNLDEDRSR